MTCSCCDKWGAHSVTSAHVDLSIDDNATWMDAFQFGKEGDTSWDLLNQSFEMDVQRNPYDAVPLLSLTTANGRIIVDDIVVRVIHFSVDAADIQANLKPGEYTYDLVMVSDTTSERVPLMHGSVCVGHGVTYTP